MDTLDLYDFTLPEELIANRGIADRTASRLMVLSASHSHVLHDSFKNIGHYLKPGDVLVVNNTKVRKAKIFAYKKTGGRLELLLIKPLPNGNWEALIIGKGPFIPNMQLSLKAENFVAQITIVGKTGTDAHVYEISSVTDLKTHADQVGELPLPPYFKRRAEPVDDTRYQTVYAKELGAVAAPTAGLHFTDELLHDLKSLGVHVVEITLHVGPGTFLPIKSSNINEHKMHSEFFILDDAAARTLNSAKDLNQRIIAVGTTSMRVLEQVMQWAKESGKNRFLACSGETSLFIRPGYHFVGCDALITNFHTPRSTLLVLVSASHFRPRKSLTSL